MILITVIETQNFGKHFSQSPKLAETNVVFFYLQATDTADAVTKQTI
jgi:hypothetical protein